MAKAKRKTTKPERNTAFMFADEPSRLAKELVRTDDDFAALSEIPVLWAFSQKPITQKGQYASYRLQKIGGMTSWLSEPIGEEGVFQAPPAKFMVTLFYDAWHLMTSEMKEATIYRVLCGMNVETLESGGKRIKVLEPDVQEYTAVIAKYGQNFLPASLMRQAVTGQMELTVSEHSDPVPGPEKPAAKPKGKIHDREFEDGRLTGAAT